MMIAVVGLWTVQRAVPSSLRREHNDVAGFIYEVVGVIYAVLLALVDLGCSTKPFGTENHLITFNTI